MERTSFEELFEQQVLDELPPAARALGKPSAPSRKGTKGGPTRRTGMVAREIERLESELLTATDTMNGVGDVQGKTSGTMHARERRVAVGAARRARGDGGATDGTAPDQSVVGGHGDAGESSVAA